MAYSIVLGDLKPLAGQLTADGAAFLLDDSIDVVTLRYVTPSGEVKAKVLTLTSPGTGAWEAVWVAGDLPEVGDYRGQIEVARPSDPTFPRTFPDDGHTLVWSVYPKI